MMQKMKIIVETLKKGILKIQAFFFKLKKIFQISLQIMHNWTFEKILLRKK